MCIRDSFYWVSSNADGSWTSVPKDLSSLKLTWATQINQTAWTLLNPSDWMVVRKQEDGTAIDPAWSTYRAAVRTKATDIVSALNAVGTVEDFVLAVCNIEWPKSPEDTTTIIQ